MRAKHKLVPSYPKTENQLHSIPEKWIVHNRTTQWQKKKLKNKSSYTETTYRGGDKDHKLICHNGKISLPPSLQQKTIDWYHEILCHPGKTRAEETTQQHFDWKGLRTMVIATWRKCELCRKAKVTNQKYWKLPAKKAKENPWDSLHVNLIGPCYKI